MLELENLTVRYGAHAAVRDATLTIAAGDRVGIVGESGSGKSTLALAMMGMVPDAAAVAGSLRIDGRDMAGADEATWRRVRGRKIAMVFQEPLAALNPQRRVGATVAEPLRVLDGMGRAQAGARVLTLFAEVGLPDPEAKALQYPHQLSGGQRQRVLIALALARNPDILIADEPTSALDAQVGLRIVELLNDLARRRGMGLVFISHDLVAVSRATDRLCVMYGGDIVETGPTTAVLAEPRHPYTTGLIAARPRIDALRARRTRMPTIDGVVPALSNLAPGCRFSGRCQFELPRCAGERPPVAVRGDARVRCHLREPAPTPVFTRTFA